MNIVNHRWSINAVYSSLTNFFSTITENIQSAIVIQRNIIDTNARDECVFSIIRVDEVEYSNEVSSSVVLCAIFDQIFQSLRQVFQHIVSTNQMRKAI